MIPFQDTRRVETAGVGLTLLLCVSSLVPGCGPKSFGPRTPTLDRGQSFLRPNEQPFGQWHYDPSDTVERYDSPQGRFAVHFTRAGTHAVSATDNDNNGIPDFVQLVASSYEEVATTYEAMGFKLPLSDATLSTTMGGGDNGGDGRFDVYLLDFGLASDGHFEADACLGETDPHCLGHIVQENDFAGYGYPSLTLAVRLIASHEYFHAVQAAYNISTDSIISEGTAVWGSEAFDPTTSDLRYQVSGYLENSDRSLDVPLPGPVNPFSYGSSLFFQFLSERYETAIVRKLWEHLEPGAGLPGGLDDPANPLWMEQLDLILKADYASSFTEAFVDFSQWNLYLAGEADPTRSYADGARYARTKREALPFPAEETALRVFHASIRSYQLQTAGRPQVEVALVDNPDTQEDETAGLHIYGATRVAGEWKIFSDTVGAEAADSKISIDAQGASEVLAVIVDTERVGASKRPGLCAGDPAEVAACLLRLSPVACTPPDNCGQSDGGVSDGGSDGGGGGSGKQGGCESAEGSPFSSFTLLALLGLFLIPVIVRRPS